MRQSFALQTREELEDEIAFLNISLTTLDPEADDAEEARRELEEKIERCVRQLDDLENGMATFGPAYAVPSFAAPPPLDTSGVSRVSSTGNVATVPGPFTHEPSSARPEAPIPDWSQQWLDRHEPAKLTSTMSSPYDLTALSSPVFEHANTENTGHAPRDVIKQEPGLESHMSSPIDFAAISSPSDENAAISSPSDENHSLESSEASPFPVKEDPGLQRVKAEPTDSPWSGLSAEGTP